MPKKDSAITAEIVQETTEPMIANRSMNPEPLEIERDEFSSEEYLDKDARLPQIQALRGTTPQTCGYFLNVDKMIQAGWLSFNEKELTDYFYESSGNVEAGILIPNPRMLVCPKTPILAYDRSASQENQQLVILGQYQRDYREDDNISNIQYYEVILLDAENRPLHQVPLSYAAKGANGASFSITWQKFINQMTNCHALANQIPARPKDSRFKSLCAFSFQTERELVGSKQKSFACRVISHDEPNSSNWKSYFLGYNKELRQVIWEGLQPTQPLMIPGTAASEVPLLPEANQ